MMNEKEAMLLSTTSLSIEVYSDVVCPWCYVGQRRLEQAIELLEPAARPKLNWRPFELNPTMPAGGMDRRAYLDAKFGSVRRVESMLDQVREAGRQSGISFAFDRMSKVPNTFDGHRLIWLAGQHDRQDEVVTAFFRGYFEEGMDLSHRETLVALAETGGLERGRILTCLTSDEGVTAVRDEEHKGLQLGIRGVPYFHRDGVAGLSGAQPPVVMADWLRRTIGDQART